MKTLTAEQLQSTLVIASMEYYKKYIKGDGEDVSKTKAAEIELKRLESIGLGKSRNAETLRDIIKVNNSQVRVSSETVTNLITTVKSLYDKALVVPYNEFFQVLKDYNLACGPISAYTGIIPETNVEEIAVATKAFQGCNLNQVNYISDLRINSDMPKATVQELVQYFSKFPFVFKGYSNGWQYMRAIGHPEFEDSLRFREYRAVQDDEWLIAAPVDTMPENTRIELYSKAEEDRRRVVEDPLVFKLHTAGVIIVSMWGEEASASVFDKYR